MSLTDNEIIKALECCVANDTTCDDCPCCNMNECGGFLQKQALDLINRKTAVIERLTNKLEQQEEMMANLGVELTTMRGAANSYKMRYEKAQTEIDKYQHIEKTVKDFWSGLKELSAFKDLQEPTLTELLEYIEQTNAEAIREFAKKICEGRVSNDPVVIAVKSELKEMVGD